MEHTGDTWSTRGTDTWSTWETDTWSTWETDTWSTWETRGACGKQSGPFLGYLLGPQEGTSLALPEASVSWTQLTWTLVPNVKKEQS